MIRWTLCLFSLLCFAASAQNILTSPLGGLAEPHPGRAMHEGSWDRSGGNADFRPVAPGETITLLDYQGAGAIHRFWCTIAPRADRDIHAQAIIRMYWDGEDKPSVEAPIGAFFGVGFGEQKDYISLPLNETSGGYNCYWPMPFHKSARWTLTNLSKKKIDAFYYNIDFTALDSLPADTRHFHAHFNRENPTTRNKNYTILDTTGAGHFVGVALFMQGRRPRTINFLEGDEMIYIDGADKPQINGTGTEDYFSSGWYYDRGPYSAPYHGVIIKDEKLARISTYRWHIEDAMPFAKSIRVTIEHGTNNDCEADYSSVAYWYQDGTNIAQPAMPKDLLPFTPPLPKSIKGAIEAESLIQSAKATAGDVHEQNMDPFDATRWSAGDQLFWTNATEGATLTLNLNAPADGTYHLIAHLTQAPDYATIQFSANGSDIGSPVDLYAPTVKPLKVDLGEAKLDKGKNQLIIKVVGNNAKSTGTYVGIDAFELKK